MEAKKTLRTGLILAGGKSSRMGTDKGLLLYKGKPFIQYSIDALLPLVDNILIVSNNPAHDAFGYQRIEDILADAGPLSGLYSGLKASKTKANLVLSCDIPLITTNVLELLLKPKNNNSIVIFKSDKRLMPLIGYYNSDCKDKVLSLLESGERRMMALLDALPTTVIPLETNLSHQLKNINTPMDLKIITNED